MVASGGTVDEEPAPLRPPGLGGESLRFLERGVERVGADVDVFGARREVELQSLLAERLDETLVGAVPSLVTGNVEAADITRCELDQRIEVWRLALIHVVTVIPTE